MTDGEAQSSNRRAPNPNAKGIRMTDLERTQTRLQHFQLGTLLGLIILVPALLGIGARREGHSRVDTL